MAASATWLGDDRGQLARDRILDAAAEAFVELGLEGAGMEDVARLAKCSRGTVYRYFENRTELRLAYIAREGARIHARMREAVQGIDEPGEAIVRGMVFALEQVRGNPTLAAWFSPASQGTTNLLAGSSSALFDMTAASLDELLEPAARAGSLRKGLNRRDAAEWVTRVMLSLLGVPGPKRRTRAQELKYLRTYLLPALLKSQEDPL